MIRYRTIGILALSFILPWCRPSFALQKLEDDLSKVEALFGDPVPKKPVVEPKAMGVRPAPVAARDAAKKEAEGIQKEVGGGLPLKGEGPMRVELQGVLKVVPQGAAEELDPLALKILQAELAFARRAAKFTPEQEDAVRKLDAAWLKKNPVQSVVQVGGGMMIQDRSKFPIPLLQRAIVKALSKELEKVLTTEQLSDYSEEKKERERFFREAMLDSIVWILDKHLSLREEQKEKIVKSLTQVGFPEMDMGLYLQNQRYLPTLPESNITRHLDTSQRDIFRSLQQVSFGQRQEADPFAFVIEK